MAEKYKKIQRNRGMTYVELIVVLSIFSVLSSVAVFNYGAFQDRVDIKNLASDITLKIVEAQNSSLAGVLPVSGGYDSSWKPSYGVYFNSSASSDVDGISFNKKFIYFTDLGTALSSQNGMFDGSTSSCTGECLDKISITKNNYISRLDACYATPCATTSPLNDLTISFSRPNSGATIKSSSIFISPVSYIQITIASPKGATSLIKLYPSGRVQVN
ncbi:MAG: type II secretion system protein [Candidatus Paceibacterota bacterium]|jgi:prepilin-type N-terminal cleavage/methylation domain-containing protein